VELFGPLTQVIMLEIEYTSSDFIDTSPQCSLSPPDSGSFLEPIT